MKLSIENLGGERGGQTIFSGVSFCLTRGEILIVTGPNGSGKSTMLRIIANLLPAAFGTVKLESEDHASPHRFPCEMMHYLGHSNALKPALSVEENLRFWQNFHGTHFPGIRVVLEETGLAGISHLPLSCLSAGQRRRVAIARLLVSDKPVWLLDEPTASLDEISQNFFADLTGKHLNNGGIIIMVTHQPLHFDDISKKQVRSLNMEDFFPENTQIREYFL